MKTFLNTILTLTAVTLLIISSPALSEIPHRSTMDNPVMDNPVMNNPVSDNMMMSEGMKQNGNSPAEPIAQCGTLVQECYTKSDKASLSNCLFTSSKHPFCEGSSLGKLTYKRWIMSPVRSVGGSDTAAGFLGPKLINQECLKSFDADFMSKLMKGAEMEQAIQSLNESLSSCNKEAAPALPRP